MSISINTDNLCWVFILFLIRFDATFFSIEVKKKKKLIVMLSPCEQNRDGCLSVVIKKIIKMMFLFFTQDLQQCEREILLHSGISSFLQ